MAVKYKTDADRWDPEPRWLAWVVVLALGGLYTALPSHLIVGPRWVLKTSSGKVARAANRDKYLAETKE